MGRGPSRQPVPDLALLRAAQVDPGSLAAKRAASELLSRYQDRVYGWCLRVVRDHDRALELAQEVLISAYRNLGSFRGHSQFSCWLFSIARNRCISELRRPGLLVDEECDPDSLTADTRDPARALEEKLDEAALLDLVRKHLQPQEQQVLWLRCIDRLPVETITEMLGIRQASGARGVLQSARRRLRAALSQQRGTNVEVGS